MFRTFHFVQGYVLFPIIGKVEDSIRVTVAVGISFSSNWYAGDTKYVRTLKLVDYLSC